MLHVICVSATRANFPFSKLSQLPALIDKLSFSVMLKNIYVNVKV